MSTVTTLEQLSNTSDLKNITDAELKKNIVDSDTITLKFDDADSDEGAGSDDEGADGDDEGAGGDDEGAGGDDEGAGSDDEGADGDDEGAGSDDEGADGDDEGADGDDEGAGSDADISEEQLLDEDADDEEDEDGSKDILSSPQLSTNGDSKNEDTESEDEDESYFQKLETDLQTKELLVYHPELMQNNYDEIKALCKITRNKDGNIIDPLHITLPFLTKYEKARVLGVRSKQLNNDADSFIDVPTNMISGILIAEDELKQKKIPYIIRRPLPNGACEYWKLEDLEIVEY